MPGPSRDGLAAPREWGHLTLLERIGSGAFGEVYRAWDNRLDREVAFKLLPPGSASGNPRVSSVIEEGRLLARVRHPNVVTIYGAERIGDRAGLWMELVKGHTLQELLDGGRRFTAAEAVRIGIELSRAVGAVHEAGLLHRDIKPHNVIVAADGRVVLMDFGTGHDRDDASAAGLAGTPLYMAPELLAGEAPSVSSDIYSLGVLLYYLVSRSYPVHARTLRRLRLAHHQHQRIEIAARRRDLPSTLTRAIQRAMDPRPTERYPSAESLAGALSDIRVRSRWLSWRLAPAATALASAAWAAWAVGGAGAGTPFRPTASSDIVRAEAQAGIATGVKNPAGISQGPPRSLAVLPFHSRAGKADDGWQLGFTEALIVQLARVKAVRIEPFASVSRYRSMQEDPLDAGRKLGVDAVVVGSLGQTDRGVSVRLRMLRTADGAVLMSEDSGERPFPDLLDARTRVAAALTAVLDPTMTAGERMRAVTEDTRSSKAFRHYLFGRYHMEMRSRERMLAAAREFRSAITLDPAYARAHAALSVALIHSAFLDDRRAIELMRPAKEAATAALALDDAVALAHTALGYVFECFEFDQVRSQAEHLRAMTLDDSDLWVLRAYASFLMRRGAFDESLGIIRRALELDPVSPLTNRHHAMLLYAARRYDQCTSVSRTTVPLDPHDLSLSYKWLGKCLEAQGRSDEAVEAYEDGRAARGDQAEAQRLKDVYRSDGKDAYWRERLRKAGNDDSWEVAGALVRLRRRKEAIDVFEQGFDRRAPWVGYINHPEWDPLIDDPRFKAMRQRLGLSARSTAQLAALRARSAPLQQH